MKKILSVLCFSTFFITAQAQSDSLGLRKISDEILSNGQCYDDLRVLCKTIGHRLSGSPAANKAVAWAQKTLIEAGADRVWLQPVEVPVWNRGDESLKIQFTASDGWEEVKVSSLGNSLGTGGKDLSAPILMVEDFKAFDALSKKDVQGKIVFFNHRFNPRYISTFEGYGDAFAYRVYSANLAANKGAAAVIIRSVSTGVDDAPHTGVMFYADTVRKIPAVAIGNTSADKLASMAPSGLCQARLNSSCQMEGTQISYNVIGEIKGTEEPEKIIVVGGHLDSWDVGEGAHDDGAGIVQSIEVLRTFANLKIKPRYTLRAVCYMNEENGAKGGQAYADSAKKHHEQHVLAIESDAGGFSPRGFGIRTKDEALRKKIKQSLLNLHWLGVYDFDNEDGGVDIRPLAEQGAVLSGLVPDSQRYFDYHHSEKDVFEAVNHRELKLGAIAMAGYIYLMNLHDIF